jgi:hypothetical protein
VIAGFLGIGGISVRLKLLLTSVGAFFLIVAFQNCAKAPAGASSSDNASGLSHINVSDNLSSGQIYVDSRLASHGSFQDPAQYNVESISAIDFNFVAQSEFAYHLDLASGILSDSNGHQTVLQPEQLAPVLGAITNSVLSSVPLMASEAIVCIEDYVDPYAQITSNVAVHVLGQGSSGCPNEDLYSASQSPLKSELIAALQALIPH